MGHTLIKVYNNGILRSEGDWQEGGDFVFRMETTPFGYLKPLFWAPFHERDQVVIEEYSPDGALLWMDYYAGLTASEKDPYVWEASRFKFKQFGRTGYRWERALVQRARAAGYDRVLLPGGGGYPILLRLGEAEPENHRHHRYVTDPENPSYKGQFGW